MNEKTNISQLRQMGHQIVDVFPFFNELELLELRLRILSPYVDKFVLVECPQTFSGNFKPLYYQENKSRFTAWSHKIQHSIITDPIESMIDVKSRLGSSNLRDEDRWMLNNAITSKLTKGDFHWKQEFFQKESIRKAIPSLNSADLVFFGDLDEIWNPVMEFNWNEDILFRLQQEVYLYWLNNKSNEDWTSPVFTAYKNLKGRLLNDLRMNSAGLEFVVVPSGGWHFSYQGGVDRIPKRLDKRKDALGRNRQFKKSEESLPSEVLVMKRELPDWFL